MPPQGTPEIVSALHTPDAHALFHAVELEFGSSLAPKPGAPTESHTVISWTELRGTAPTGPRSVIMQVSLDGGDTWNTQTNGASIIGTAAGDVMNGKALLLRTLLFGSGEDAPKLLSTYVEVNFANGDQIVRQELPGDPTYPLEAGAFLFAEFDGSQAGGLVKKSETRFLDSTTATNNALDHLVPVNPPEFLPGPNSSTPADTRLHLSNGKWILTGSQDVFILIVPDTDTDLTDNEKDADRAKREMAFELWLNPATVGTDQQILKWKTFVQLNQQDERDSVWLTLKADGSLEFRVEEFHIQDVNNLSGRDRRLTTPAGTIQAGTWQHVAMTYDGLFAQLWINGQVINRARMQVTKPWQGGPGSKTKAFYGLVFRTDGRFFLGGGPGPMSEDTDDVPYTGLISELRMYRRAAAGSIGRRWQRRLRAEEIPEMQADELTKLEAYYPLDGPSADPLALDSTTNGNDLKRPQPNALTIINFGTSWEELRPFGPSSLPAGARTSPSLSLDTQGDTIRVTDAPFDFDFDSKTFSGVGHMGQLSVIQDRAQLVPTALEMELNGIAAEHISAALQADYLDRPARAWAVMFDRQGALVEDPLKIFEGRMDQMSIGVSNVAAVQVTAVSHLADWERSSGAAWNHQQHLARFPGDLSLEFMAEIVEKQIWWPANLSDEDLTENP